MLKNRPRSRVQKLTKYAKQSATLNNAVFALAILIGISLIWNTVQSIEKNFTLQTQVDEITNEIELLELENQRLELSNDYYESDSYLELAARKNFGLVANGEKVLVLPDYSGITTLEEVSAQANELKSDPTNFDRWMYFLFRREL